MRISEACGVRVRPFIPVLLLWDAASSRAAQRKKTGARQTAEEEGVVTRWGEGTDLLHEGAAANMSVAFSCSFHEDPAGSSPRESSVDE
jgi:hypothetical protein